MIKYTDSPQNITTEMLTGFFQDWKKPLTPEDHLRILQNSDHIVLTIDTSKHRVVGFITAITDNVQSAFISLLSGKPKRF